MQTSFFYPKKQKIVLIKIQHKIIFQTIFKLFLWIQIELHLKFWSEIQKKIYERIQK